MTVGLQIKLPPIPDIADEQRSPIVDRLIDTCSLQQEVILSLQEQVQVLRDEIARLKNQKPKPKIKPSSLENRPDKKKKHRKKKSGKRHKNLAIHETVDVKPDNLPAGSRFKGYDCFTVQDLVICAHNIRYRLERWKTPSGDYVVGELPKQVKGHFGSTLISFILYQYYHAHVTQPLIWEELLEFGIDISTGKINNIITEGNDIFHLEKDQILSTGLEVSRYVHVDDTGARHKGQNGYCTHIGNELFAWFKSTRYKSRANFLTLLQAGHSDYLLNVDAFGYMTDYKFPKGKLAQMTSHDLTRFDTKAQWESLLKELGIVSDIHVRIATEGALLASILEHGINPDLVIISDDAGQFDVFVHALCWIHAERALNKIVGINDKQRKAIDNVRTQFWDLYDRLKLFKQRPTEAKKVKLSACFDKLFTTETCCMTLNLALKRIYKNKSELLLVLQRPDIPLHNNLSERDIREYVKKRKISGSTRSDVGRRCRDTFTSLKKTCRKLDVSFWKYLLDRVIGSHQIPLLGDLVRQRALG
ncbi:MAG: transposase [candidate division Zixibacteria bacterium]